MVLIHTALLCEAQIFIERFKLKKISSTPKIYKNDYFILCISGIGKENTLKNIKFIFNNYTIKKAFNIGIAGCNNKDIKIGDIFITNKTITDIKYMNLITKNTITNTNTVNRVSLFDMEGIYFLDLSMKYISNDNIFIFKIVSDHLNTNHINKQFVKHLIVDKFITIKKYML
ncbi:MAG: hypothetical protein U9R37_06030 [Campylobacterota bacterium]|nr:hypothetical protein [Campylobacterota bacterium]